MGKVAEQKILEILLKRYGRTFAEELNIAVKENTSSQLFRLLCASLLFSTRIKVNIAIRAFKALENHGWTTPEKMADATWEERTKALNKSGYARYDESTSGKLGTDAKMILDRYCGDLNRLREEAGRDPDRERQLLMEFKGIGNVGADIFFREVQAAWDEVFPFADKRALQSAQKLGLPDDPEKLLSLTGKQQFVRLMAALIRVELNKDHEEIIRQAQKS